LAGNRSYKITHFRREAKDARHKKFRLRMAKPLKNKRRNKRSDSIGARASLPASRLSAAKNGESLSLKSTFEKIEMAARSVLAKPRTRGRAEMPALQFCRSNLCAPIFYGFYFSNAVTILILSNAAH
jgi:hypothetical protein